MRPFFTLTLRRTCLTMRPRQFSPGSKKGECMSRNPVDLVALEELRESGDYDKIAALLVDDWQSAPEFDDEAIRLRLLAAELAGRNGSLPEMESALAPYIEDISRVPFGLSARVLLMLAVYHYRRNEPSE